MNLLFALTRCPLCKTNPSSAKGCCTPCQKTLFTPIIGSFEIALGVYGSKLEKAVRALKYHQVTSLGGLFASELTRLIKQEHWQLDIVTAIPLHWLRYLQRGYNQAGLIAKPLARDLALPYQTLLKRKRYTKQQAKLSGIERQKNVQDVFSAVKGLNLQGKRILLLDDVMTTGLTLQAAKDALLLAGAKEVKIAVIAKALR